MERTRQLKIRISDAEWEMIDSIMDYEDRSASESIREFIHRRFREIERLPREDPASIANDLRALASRVGRLARGPATPPR